MLPPIRKSSNTPLSSAGAYNPPAGNTSNTLAGAGSAGPGGERHGDAAPGKAFRDEPQYSAGAPSASNNFMLDRIHSLERENELIRAELSHFRQHLSNNQQQREDERLSLTKVSDELQRLVHAFNSKLQADSVFQQRQQQKCALLFAEVARLGHSIEGVELAMKTVSDDTRRRFEVHEQQLQYASTVSKQQQSSQVSAQRSEETQQQIEELQHALTLVKNAHAQFRSEVETERNERWRTDSERNQWMGDLRSTVAKIDASMDAKIIHQVERLNNKLTTDKMDMMRLLEEYRELMTGADFKRISSQMLEFSRINDHLLALERWIHTEFGHIKRVFQFVISDTDGRLQALTLEVVAGMKSWHAVLMQQDDEHRVRLQDIYNAVGEVAYAMQKKLFALEDVLPMEVKARQQNDDKLRKRIEGVVKSLSKALEATREECIVPQAQLKARMKIVEDAQRQIADQVDEKHEVVSQTIQEFIKDSDTTLAKLSNYVEMERQKTQVPSGDDAAVVDCGENEETVALSEAPTIAADQPSSEDLLAAVRLEWTTFFETQLPPRLTELKSSLMDEVDRKIVLLSETISTQELQPLQEQLHQDRLSIQGLQAWTVSHAQECRQCYDYLNWAVEDAKTEESVYHCLKAVIDQMVDTAALEEFQLLEDNTSWAVAQVTEIQGRQQTTNASISNGFEQQQVETATNDDPLDESSQDVVGNGPQSDLSAATVNRNTNEGTGDGAVADAEATVETEAPTQVPNDDTAEAEEDGADGGNVWL
ncbi:hypothetical protein Gpo141_00009421 [Globisporangium polare]